MNPAKIQSLNRWLRTQGVAGRIRVKEVIIAGDLYRRLGQILKRWLRADRQVVVVMDRTPMRRAGRNAKAEFLKILRQHCRPKVVRLGTPEHPPHASYELAESVARSLPAGCLAIAFGSGTITDITKHARFLAEQGFAGHRRREFICIPTACTVTAFSSALAVMSIAGVKRTIPSQAPDAVWIDLALLADAPADLTRAGVGDLFARATAYADWYISSVLGIDESYNDIPRLLLADHERTLYRSTAALAAGDLRAYRLLIEALLLAGYAMSITGQTAPISGWEHVMSHYLDLLANATGQQTGLHGLQVAAGTFVAARAYRHLLAKLKAEDLLHAAEVDLAARARRQISRHFAPFDPTGDMRAELVRDYMPKAEAWNQAATRLKKFAKQWKTGDAVDTLKDLLVDLQTLYAAAGPLAIPTTLTQLSPLPTDSAPIDAVRYAHLVRRRFTLGDLLSALGWLRPGRIRRWLQG